MKISHKIILLIFFFLIWASNSNATESYGKLWGSATITGPFFPDSNFRYYLQPDVRFINDPYVFNQLLLQPGLGYQFNPRLVFYGGIGWIVDKNPQGITSHEDRLWEQLNWLMANTNTFDINIRTRFEENKNLDQSQIAYRFRERIWLRIPFKSSPTHSFSCFDEIFLNLNHPQWVSPYFFAQNRAFVGIGTQFSKTTILDVGYLNQYIHNRQNQLNNVLLFTLTITN